MYLPRNETCPSDLRLVLIPDPRRRGLVDLADLVDHQRRSSVPRLQVVRRRNGHDHEGLRENDVSRRRRRNVLKRIAENGPRVVSANVERSHEKRLELYHEHRKPHQTGAQNHVALTRRRQQLHRSLRSRSSQPLHLRLQRPHTSPR